MQYDYVIVGAGLFGAVCAHELHKKGKRVLVLEKRDHIGGNVYTEDQDGIQVHKYGAHIFHTNDKDIWDYVNSFVEFNRFTNSPLAMHNGKLYNTPFISFGGSRRQRRPWPRLMNKKPKWRAKSQLTWKSKQSL